jgi:hypothetical protein
MKLKIMTATGVALLVGALGPAVPAVAASGTAMPAGGPVKVFVTPSGASGEHGTILIIVARPTPTATTPKSRSKKARSTST